MATAAENLVTAFNQACARLSELDTVPLSERARMTYSEDGQSYDWNSYRSALLQQIKDFPEALKGAQAAAGPWTVLGRAGY